MISRWTPAGQSGLAGRERSGGQALTEFALVVPVLFLILFAIIQFGFLLGGHVGLTNAAREAARYASTVPNATSAQVLGELRTNSMPRWIPNFRALGGQNESAGSTVTYCSVANPNNASDYPSYSVRVRVHAVYRHALFVPLIDLIVDTLDGTSDGALTARVTEEMRVENPRLTTTGGLPGC